MKSDGAGALAVAAPELAAVLVPRTLEKSDGPVAPLDAPALDVVAPEAGVVAGAEVLGFIKLNAPPLVPPPEPMFENILLGAAPVDAGVDWLAPTPPRGFVGVDVVVVAGWEDAG